MKIAGIDLAWRSEKNTTAVAIGVLRGAVFRLEVVHEAIAGLDAIVHVIEQDGNRVRFTQLTNDENPGG